MRGICFCCLKSSRHTFHFLVPATAEEVTQQSKLLYGTSNGAEKELHHGDQECKRHRYTMDIKSRTLSISSLSISHRAHALTELPSTDISLLQGINELRQFWARGLFWFDHVTLLALKFQWFIVCYLWNPSETGTSLWHLLFCLSSKCGTF